MTLGSMRLDSPSVALMSGGALVGACAATGVAIWYFTRYGFKSVGAPSRGGRESASPSSAPTPLGGTASGLNCRNNASAAVEAALTAEQLSRNRQFFGAQGQDKVENAFVIVVGCGGVGSHAAHMLARSGVARLRLIDGDNVTLSSLNRAATATRADVGTPKVDALARAIAAFSGTSCVVETHTTFLDASSATALLAGSPALVIDCIDDTEAKVALLLECARLKIRVLSSLGAGGAADPTRIRFADLALIHGDALGVTIKYELRRAGLFRAHDAAVAAVRATAGLPGEGRAPAPPPPLSGITALFLADEPRVTLLPLELNAGEKADDYGARAGVRVRIMPVFGPLPAVFGNALAAWALCYLAGPEHVLAPLEAGGSPPRALFKLRCRLERWEEAHAAHGYLRGCTTGASDDDVAFVVDTVFHARSALSHVRLGTRGVTLEIVRWRPWAPTIPSNLVLVTDDEARTLMLACSQAGLRGLADAAVAVGANLNAPRGDVVSSAAADAFDALEAAWQGAVDAAVGQAAAAQVAARLEWVKRAGWA